MAWRPPQVPGPLRFQSPIAGLPAPDAVAAALRDTPLAAELLRIAREIRVHRLPLLGIELYTGPNIHWRRDYLSGIETGRDYFRTVPYLDAARAGDHKIIWELNRHQHLVLLAQAFLFDGDEENLRHIDEQIEKWWLQNPFNYGINWASALEVAFRAVSWIWIWHLLGPRLHPGPRNLLLAGLFQHGRHLENNLSFYFSPNTHLLGEAVALHALGALFPRMSRARRWRTLGRRVVHEQMAKQVRADGSHFEQSTYYHVYALDMFLFHAVMEAPGPDYLTKLARMAEFLDALLGPARRLPFIGDDDGGRFFHPFGHRDRFGVATLSTCGVMLNRPEWIGPRMSLCEQAVWWLGPRALEAAAAEHSPRKSALFRAAGLAVMTDGDVQIIADAGPFGPFGAGHSHSDTLSFVVSIGTEPVLIDPGTYTYVGDPAARDWFRGSAAHNTIRVDGRDQAIATGPFRWNDKPLVRLREWSSTDTEDVLDAECEYGGFTHRRRIVFEKPGRVRVVDEVSGPDGEHEVEQWWHPASETEAARIVLPEPGQMVGSWRSYAFGERRPAPAIVVRRRGPLPMRFEATIQLEN